MFWCFKIKLDLDFSTVGGLELRWIRQRVEKFCVGTSEVAVTYVTYFFESTTTYCVFLGQVDSFDIHQEH